MTTSFPFYVERPFLTIPVTVYYETEKMTHGRRGQFGEPLEPDELPMVTVIAVVDEEIPRENIIDELSVSEMDAINEAACADFYAQTCVG